MKEEQRLMMAWFIANRAPGAEHRAICIECKKIKDKREFPILFERKVNVGQSEKWLGLGVCRECG